MKPVYIAVLILALIFQMVLGAPGVGVCVDIERKVSSAKSLVRQGGNSAVLGNMQLNQLRAQVAVNSCRSI